MKKKYLSPALLFFGVITLFASIFVGYYVIPYEIRRNVLLNSMIKKGNPYYEGWNSLPETVQLYQRLFLFHVANPEEVIRGGKPILVERGPFIYQQKSRKVDIVFHEGNGTISYREEMYFYFRPELSNGSLDDPITFVNLLYVNTAHKASQLDTITRFVISETLKKYPEEQLYMNTTVGKLLFEGIYTPFIHELGELNGEEILPNSTFGIYYGTNGTDQGQFEIYSGVKNPDKFGDVASWNGKTSLDWWEDQYCNKINGSDGGVFRPYSNNESIFYMFIPGVCKSFKFSYENELGLKVKGIPVLKFTVKPSFLANPKENPDNACFCLDPGKNFENCPESGVFPLEACGKAAMMLSQPHFYQGSDIHLNRCIGLNPQKERHEMAVWVETYTSTPARVSMRFQMNVGLNPNKFFRPLKKIPRMVHPLFWIDQTVDLPDDAAYLLRDKLHFTINLSALLTQVGIIVGSSLIIVALLSFCLCSIREPKKEDVDSHDCVTYQPNGTISNGKINMVKTTGILPNGSLLNGKNSSKKQTVQLDTTASSGTEKELIPLMKQNGVDKSHANGAVPACTNPDVTITNSKSPILTKNSNKQPDSQLNPFPVIMDFSSSSSIGPDRLNALRDIVEATSSYENL